jgi:hypothetical protein
MLPFVTDSACILVSLARRKRRRRLSLLQTSAKESDYKPGAQEGFIKA